MLDKEYFAAGWFDYEIGALLARHLPGLTSGPIKQGKIVADLGVYGVPRRFDHTAGEEDFHILCPGSEKHPVLAMRYFTSGRILQGYLSNQLA